MKETTVDLPARRERRQAIQHARALGALAAHDSADVFDNPYHPINDNEEYRHWLEMYSKTRWHLREAKLASQDK